MNGLAAIILAGGASARMGADKALMLWNGVRAVDRVVALARGVGADAVMVAGGDYGLPFVADPSPRAGPVAGLLAGRQAVTADRLMVLAVDAPTLTREDLAPLLAAGAPGACYDGLPLPMVIHAAAFPSGAKDDWPLRRFVEQAGLAVLPVPVDSHRRLRGANTPDEARALAPKD